MSPPVSGILSPTLAGVRVAIHLCSPPEGGAHRLPSEHRTGSPAFDSTLLRVGFTKPPGHPDAGALLPHRFTLPCSRAARCRVVRAIGGLFSVALSCGSPRLAVSQHPALRSPDFPRCQRPKAPAPRPPGGLIVVMDCR